MAKIAKSDEDTSLYGVLFPMRMLFKNHHSDGKDKEKTSNYSMFGLCFVCVDVSNILKFLDYETDNIVSNICAWRCYGGCCHCDAHHATFGS